VPAAGVFAGGLSFVGATGKKRWLHDELAIFKLPARADLAVCPRWPQRRVVVVAAEVRPAVDAVFLALRESIIFAVGRRNAGVVRGAGVLLDARCFTGGAVCVWGRGVVGWHALRIFVALKPVSALLLAGGAVGIFTVSGLDALVVDAIKRDVTGLLALFKRFVCTFWAITRAECVCVAFSNSSLNAFFLATTLIDAAIAELCHALSSAALGDALRERLAPLL
jgi:hypothetical protein